MKRKLRWYPGGAQGVSAVFPDETTEWIVAVVKDTGISTRRREWLCPPETSVYWRRIEWWMPESELLQTTPYVTVQREFLAATETDRH